MNPASGQIRLGAAAHKIKACQELDKQNQEYKINKSRHEALHCNLLYYLASLH
jgi:hypothetical protein